MLLLIWSKLFSLINDVIIYLDDILIISGTWTEHLNALNEFFSICVNNGINISQEKSYVAMNSVSFLAYKIDKTGIKPCDKHIQTISNFPSFKNRIRDIFFHRMVMIDNPVG